MGMSTDEEILAQSDDIDDEEGEGDEEDDVPELMLKLLSNMLTTCTIF